MRVHPDTKRLALDICVLLWDYYEPRTLPRWLEPGWSWVSRWKTTNEPSLRR